MTLRGDLSIASRLARVELVAMWRRLTANRRRFAGVAIGLLQFVVLLPVLFWGRALSFGRDLASGTPPVGTVGAVCTGAVAFGLYLGVMTAINRNRIGSVGPLLRTSTTPRAVAAGRLASETTQASVMFAVPALVVLVLVGIGAGHPVPGLLFAGLLAGSLLVGLFLGRAVGAGARVGGFLSDLSAWTKVVGFVIVVAVFFLGVQALIGAILPQDSDVGRVVSVPVLLPGRPIQAGAGIVLAPLGAPVRPLGVLILGAGVAAIPLGLLATLRFETALLFADAGDVAETETRSRTVPWPFSKTRSGRIAFRHLLRTVRDPKSLAHVAPLLFGGLGAGVWWLGQPDVALTMGPPAAVVLGAVLAGLLYCLNPLGDDRQQLPLLKTSAASTAVFLRGRVLAGAAVGLLFAVGLATPLAVFSYPPGYVALQAGLAVVLVFASSAAALGLGAFAPTFERREYMNVERAHPSQRATMGFLFGDALLGGAGLYLALITVSGQVRPLVLAGAWVVYLAVILGVGLGGYVYAVRRFDALTLDDV